ERGPGPRVAEVRKRAPLAAPLSARPAPHPPHFALGAVRRAQPALAHAPQDLELGGAPVGAEGAAILLPVRERMGRHDLLLSGNEIALGRGEDLPALLAALAAGVEDHVAPGREQRADRAHRLTSSS